MNLKNEPSPYTHKLEQMLGERGAYDGETDAYAVLYGISLDLLTECSALRATEDNLRAQIGQGEPVAWSPALDYPRYEKERVWCNGKPRQEDIDYWEKHGNGITLAYTHPAPQQKPLTDEQQIAEALRKHGFALVKTATGYDVMKLGPCIAHNIGEKK